MVTQCIQVTKENNIKSVVRCRDSRTGRKKQIGMIAPYTFWGPWVPCATCSSEAFHTFCPTTHDIEESSREVHIHTPASIITSELDNAA